MPSLYGNLVLTSARVNLSSPTTMAKKNAAKRETPSNISLSQPDRSGPDPSQKTLFALAEERGLLDPENHRLKNGKVPKNAVPTRPPTPDEDLSRLGNSVLWSISMAMLHLTFDVLTQHQYSEQIFWEDLAVRSAQAFVGTSSLPRSALCVFPPRIILRDSCDIDPPSNTHTLLHPAPLPPTTQVHPYPPTSGSSMHILRRKCSRRLPAHPHYKCVQLLPRSETSPSSGCALDLVYY